MAKNRKNVSVFDLPQVEIQQAAKQVQEESIATIPKSITTAPSQQAAVISESAKAEKLKIIYVDLPYHTKAKATAASRGMKLGEYIEHLIEQDKG
jgi:16S rRNA G966 N2-methylase RsmD